MNDASFVFFVFYRGQLFGKKNYTIVVRITTDQMDSQMFLLLLGERLREGEPFSFQAGRADCPSPLHKFTHSRRLFVIPADAAPNPL